MSFDRMARILWELKNNSNIKSTAKSDLEKYNELKKITKRKDEGKKNVQVEEFLSSKMKVFSEFDDMASFAVSILRASSYPFFIVDKNMKIQYMNPACLNFTGLKLNESVGKVNCKRVFNSNQCEKKCAIKQAMGTQKSVIGKRVKVTDKFGQEHTIIVTAGPLVDKKGNVLGGFEVWRDAMPEEEVTMRSNLLLEKVKDYCWDTEVFLDGIEKRPFPKELDNKENWDRLIGEMKRRTSYLQDYCRNFMKSSCWEILNCPPERQVQCPSFPNHGSKCWEIDHTWCEGQMQGTASEKREQCEQCSVYIRKKS